MPPPIRSSPEETLKIRANIDRLRGEQEPRMSVATLAGSAAIPLTTWYRRMEDPGQLTVRELGLIAKALQCSLADLVR